MVQKLERNHKVLCTSRQYREVVELAKLKQMDLRFVGRHGGSRREEKLRASIQRMDRLLKMVSKFGPQTTVSFCSPEASRVSFGLGIKHVVFSDSPHAEAVMRLSLPLANKVLTPWIIPKREFTRYGVTPHDIVQYKAIDAAVIVKEKSNVKPFPVNKDKKTIIIRTEESEAAYAMRRKFPSENIINKFSKLNHKYNIIVLPRYSSQKYYLKQKFGKTVKVMDRVVDGKSLLLSADVFIGSGGTMTAESALMGVRTISYDAIPNHVEKYLVKKRVVKRETNPETIVSSAEKMLSDSTDFGHKASAILNSMEDPFEKLITAIKN